MNDIPDVATLVSGLESENEAARKYAVFKLQSLLQDPEFADAFVQGDGVGPLRQCVLETTGNAQAYALGSLDVLLDQDIGWEAVDSVLIGKVVDLAVTNPLVNIVRNALTLLVLVVSRPLANRLPPPGANVGFRAIKPALDKHADFLESLVQRLNASDHTLCANALQLVNSLMRDAIMHGGETEWPKFIKRLQDLGVIGGVGMLMRSEAASDATSPLAAAIFEFQGLTKILLRKWRSVPVNTESAEHKRALKTIYVLSQTEASSSTTPPADRDGIPGKSPSRKAHSDKWRRLGFETERPAAEFDDTGYLGIMDLVEFARRNEDIYQKTFMEQAVQAKDNRCPLARASMAITLILYEHFELDSIHDFEESDFDHSTLSGASVDRLYRPLLLQWGRLHTAALNSFIRLWKLADATTDDFYKLEELVRIVVDRIVGNAARRAEIATVEEELRDFSLTDARRWQTEGLDEIYDDAWGPDLVQTREQLYHESLQFMKEQRIRCLLKGSWFPITTEPNANSVSAWRFVRLSHNRRWLHYKNYSSKRGDDIPLTDLSERIDLNAVTSVDSNVSASDPVSNGLSDANKSAETLTTNAVKILTPSTKITILGKNPSLTSTSEDDEVALLELLPQTPNLASEWLDGLLLLLDQQPITKTTTSLIDMMTDWGIRLRMLNLRWDDIDWDGLEARTRGVNISAHEVPTREGVDDDYWYAMAQG